MGDDLADLPVLRAVGLAACPADAAAEVRQAAHLVTTGRRRPGGRPRGRRDHLEDTRGPGTGWSHAIPAPGLSLDERQRTGAPAAPRARPVTTPSLGPDRAADMAVFKKASRSRRPSACCWRATPATSGSSRSWSRSVARPGRHQPALPWYHESETKRRGDRPGRQAVRPRALERRPRTCRSATTTTNAATGCTPRSTSGSTTASSPARPFAIIWESRDGKAAQDGDQRRGGRSTSTSRSAW